MSDLGNQAEWFFIGAAEEVATQTLSVDVTTSNSATQTDLEVAEEVAATALDAASRLDAGRALFWMGLGFTFLAGAWLMYPKKDAGQNDPQPEETKAAGTTAEDPAAEKPTHQPPQPPNQPPQPPMTRKDWAGPVPTLPNLEPFATKQPQLCQLQMPGPSPSQQAAHVEHKTQRDSEVKDESAATDPEMLAEDTMNRKMALVFAASALFLFTGFKLTRSLGKRANLDLFAEAPIRNKVPASSVRQGYTNPNVQKSQVEAVPKTKAKETSHVVCTNPVEGKGFVDRPPEADCDANMEILQKQKLHRNSTTAEVRVANGVVRPVPPTSCHIFRILPKQ